MEQPLLPLHFSVASMLFTMNALSKRVDPFNLFERLGYISAIYIQFHGIIRANSRGNRDALDVYSVKQSNYFRLFFGVGKEISVERG